MIVFGMPTVNFDRLIGLGGFAVGVLGLGMAYHFGRRSEKIRKPTFSIQAGRDVLVQSVLLKFQDFKVLHKGIALTDNNLIGMRFRFWNSGSLAILADDILTPFRATFPDGCQLLDVRIPTVSRGEVGAKVALDKTSILITAAVIEPNDGLTIQVIYSGPADAKVEFSGACIGAKQVTVLDPELVRDVPLSKRVKTLVLNLLPITIVLALVEVVESPFARTLPRTVRYLSGSILVVGGLLAATLVCYHIYRWLSIRSVPAALMRE